MRRTMTVALLPLPPRATYPLPLVPALKAYIASAYGEDPEQYASDFAALDLQRQELGSPDTHDSYVATLWKHYANLLVLEAKFPIGENGIKVFFTWTSALGQSARQHSLPSVHYECASVLYNIAAAYSAIAATISKTTMDSIKRAANYFQLAAGTAAYILEQRELWNLPEDDDFNPRVMNFVVNLCLGQSQECYVAKAKLDRMKPGLVARLSMAAAFFYNKALGDAELVRYHFTPFAKIKSFQYIADACYHKSLESAAAMRFGEQVAWLRRAKDILSKTFASTFLENPVVSQVGNEVQVQVKQLNTLVTQCLTQALADNDNIYMQLVPEDQTLPAIAAAKLAEPTRAYGDFKLADFHEVTKGKQVFFHLVPMAVHQDVSEYYALRDKQVNEVVNSLQGLDRLYANSLKELGLPEMLHVIEKPTLIPDPVVRNSESVKQQGGLVYIDECFKEVRTRLTAINDTILRCSTDLEQETMNDSISRQKYGESWVRPNSHTVNDAYRKAIDRYNVFISEGATEDRITRDILEQNRTFIDYLCMDKDQLVSIIPKAKNAATPQQKQDVEQLVPLLKQGEECKKWRSETVKKIKLFAKDDDIVNTLLGYINDNKKYDKRDLFNSELQKYNQYQQAATTHEEQMVNLVTMVTEKSVTLKQIVANNPALAAVEVVVTNISLGYTAYMDLSMRLKDAKGFYTKLNKALQALHAQITDFVAVREKERVDMIRQIESHK